MTTGFASGVVNGWLATFATATCWVKLHTADPGAAGATAAAAGDTSRKQATMSTASGGATSATGAVGPWTNASTSETLSHISIWSASTAGTFQASGALSSSQAWASTNTFSLTALAISVTPIAA